MREIMIDIETLGIPEEIPKGYLMEVTHIGAVKFGPDGIEDEEEWFPAEGNGLATGGTVTFWLQQILQRGAGEVRVPRWAYERMDAHSTRDARSGFKALASMKTCLEGLTRFIGMNKPVVWSKGGFDLDILLDHYGANQLVCPWRYYEQRDLRTVMKECGVSRSYEDAVHDALVDARDQVGLLMECRQCFSRRGVA